MRNLAAEVVPRSGHRPLHSLVVIVCLVGFTACLDKLAKAESPAASGWSRFHGDKGLGYVPDGRIPNNWTDTEYAWRRKLGSRDVGSPVIIDSKIYMLVSKPDQGKIAVESFDLADGTPRWSKSFAQHSYHLHNRNTLASSTPAADAENIFVAFADPDHTFLKCFDHEGNQKWSRDFGSWKSQHGFGTSPCIVGSLVLLFNSQQRDQLKPDETPGKSRMIAVNRDTGETVWETKLVTTRSCYGVPAIYGDCDSGQIVASNTGNGMFGIDIPSGKILWNTKVFEMRCCSTPLVAGDLAIATSGSGGGGGNHLVAVRIPKSVKDKPEQVYRIDRNAPYVPTPVLKEGLLYLVDDRGIASCLDSQSGHVLWTKRIGGNYGASPIVIGDTILIISLDGKATLLKASKQYEKLGEVDLQGPVGATPAYAEGRLLIRVDDELRCLGKTL